MASETIGIAKIFHSFQGEGIYAGCPMLFVRTAGCSVGCPGCDTNYKLTRRMGIEELADCIQKAPEQSVWITGGEPTDWKYLDRLLDQIVAKHLILATSGIRDASRWETYCSPHSPQQFQWHKHRQINLVPGLNELSEDACRWYIENWEYDYCFLTPLDGKDRPKSLASCKRLVTEFQGKCRLGIQAHKLWEVE